jgi:hypothetical protein
MEPDENHSCRMEVLITAFMDKFDNTNGLVNFMFSFIIMENMQNNEGHTPFKDLTNTIKGGNCLYSCP